MPYTRAKQNQMIVETAAAATLNLLNETQANIPPADYTRPCKELNGASVGQHYRHIIEMFECLLNGYNTGLINYDNRKRDVRLETDKSFAAAVIVQLTQSIYLPDKPLQLAAAYATDTHTTQYFSTTYQRELAYTLEHAVHHMAILKIGLRFILPALQLPANFGVAASTIRHKSFNAG